MRLRGILLLLPLLLPAVILGQSKKSSSSDEENLVRLVSADTLQMVQIRGISYRKVKGRPAKFLHNNTYLLCDSALWNVDSKVINAIGHVKILQEQTELTSDNLTYFVDRDMAEFRGGLVQLRDKDHNTLRTRYLDYNTKDSVAVFRNGGAMRDKDGQIIESRTGTYDSKIKTFTFNDDVNMFTDSVFVKTTYLKYESDKNTATFGYNTNAWRDDDMLSANAGWYDRDREQFFFNRSVHVMTDTQEGWCDSLYFNRNTQDVLMLGNAQVTDSTRAVSALAGKIEYIDSVSMVTLLREPAVVAEIEEKDDHGKTQKDTVFIGADTLKYFTVKKYQVDSIEIVNAGERLKAVDTDPVTTLRHDAAEAARKAAEEAAANDPNNPNNPMYRKGGEQPGDGDEGAKEDKTSKGDRKAGSGKDRKGGKDSAADMLEAPAALKAEAAPASETGSDADAPAAPIDTLGTARDSLSTPLDSLATPLDSLSTPLDSLSTPLDSLAAGADSLAKEPLDTTKIGFARAFHNVRIYRRKMQAVCDSLVYTDLDSLARMYKEPVIWNEGGHQYCSDSLYIIIHNENIDRANLMSNAFVHIEEDTLHYDQVKSAEMTAFFNPDGGLSRFDALGGAQALFYIEEHDVLATVNKKDCKMLSARFKDGNIEKIFYFDTAQSDAYPVVQLTKEEQRLKGFNWQPDRQPKDRSAVTPLSLRSSQRSKYSAVPHAKFAQTDEYFPGYMTDVYHRMAVRDSLKREQAAREERMKALREQEEREAARKALADSIARADSLVLADSLANVADSLAGVAAQAADSLGVSDFSLDDAVSALADSVATSARVLSPEGEKAAERDRKLADKAAKKAQKDSLKQARQAALEAKWAAQDAAYEAKQAAKAEKKAAKERKKKLRQLKIKEKLEAKEQKIFERYKARYEKKKARDERKAGKAVENRDSGEKMESPEIIDKSDNKEYGSIDREIS